MLSDDFDRLLGDLNVAGDVKSHQVGAICCQRDQARVGQATAACKGQSLDAVASGQGNNTSIVDFCGQLCKVETFHKICVSIVWPLEGEGFADHAMFLPCRTSRSVPQLVDRISRPSLAGEHDIAQVGRGGQFGEDGNQDLVGQSLDRRQTVIVIGDLYILHRDAQ